MGALVIVALIGLMPALSGGAAALPLTGVQLPGVYLACNEGGPTTLTFPADTPFYVAHGWIQPGWRDPSVTTPELRKATLSPTTFFEFFIDGARVRSVPWMGYDPTTDWFTKGNVSNFPAGMPAGTYTLEAIWYFDGGWLAGCTMTETFV